MIIIAFVVARSKRESAMHFRSRARFGRRFPFISAVGDDFIIIIKEISRFSGQIEESYQGKPSWPHRDASFSYFRDAFGNCWSRRMAICRKWSELRKYQSSTQSRISSLHTYQLRGKKISQASRRSRCAICNIVFFVIQEIYICFLSFLLITRNFTKCGLFAQVQRLADYERYLGQEARSLIDSECIDSGSVLHRGQLEGDLHRIQELFPGDNLRLHERDVVTTVRSVSW